MVPSSFHHLADDARGVEAGEARQIHRTFRLPGADQHSSLARLEREDVPGRTTSLGFASGSMAALIVVARPAALIPVVHRRLAASMLTVKAVA